MKVDQKYKRLIRIFFTFGITSMLIVLYGWTWIGHYNRIIEFPFFRRGNWMMIFLYGILLVLFMSIYGGFKVGYLKKGNLIYSQILAVIFTNIFTYLQIAVLDKHFLSPLQLIKMTGLDFLIIIVWTLVYQWFYGKVFPPRKMLLISGGRSDYHLAEKINSREDKYEICRTINIKKGIVILQQEILNYDGVIIGDISSHERNLILKYCFANSIRTYNVPKISDILLKSSVELNLFDSPLLLSRNEGMTIEQLFIKRLVDIVGALIGIVIASPLFLIISVLISLTDKGPIFFKQARLTRDDKVFYIYKFRTMIQEAEKDGVARLAEEGDSRILPIGHFLRRTRLDELPQLFNILRGEMSLVGPRPERPELVEEILKDIPEFTYRTKVKAGLTGYAQIYGKYNTTAYDKLKLDLTYIRNYSFLLDLKLIFMTPKIMFMKEATEGVQSNIEK
ncbi:exopolysaccharide biosynthesis polyprenyl glycosylphosphotransferase [Lacrimispora sphenoides]|uniref:Exopolysaccharide biosynthesis polyprenyl glycosylphosphotransferase n=1 Tax=Lacrimispora sphenoides JCM 1415 TaxID=1297793 RepID=A0ABY1CDR6_9FIRM|nr:exopolysaccharide biosynthesis polyprenyl glycosylphosphotransferase [Lacrimispora sphenoides]SET96080.1 exopolysaccharide biosynthesis polyprenyl glycosylphosphotransferase [[Clostridium] sphenoides JCM 1415]